MSVARATRLRRCRNSGEGAGANDETENRVDTFARPSEQASQATPLRAALSGKCCVAEGVSARGNTPILALCRALMAAGYDPDRALHVYRGSVLAVIVSAIGKAAKLTVEDDSRGKPRFRLKRDRTGGTALLERHSVPRDSDGCPTKVRSGTPRHPPKADRNEILVAATDPLSGRISAMTESVNENPHKSVIVPHPLAVDRHELGLRRDKPVRTVAPHGLTGRELKRLQGATRYMTLHCRRGCSELWWLTTDKQSSRDIIAGIWKRIGPLQKKFDLPAYSALVFEASNGLHAHVIFVGNEPIANRLRGANFGMFVKVDRVYDVQGLGRGYLAKERSPQAGFGQRDLGGRLRGSHRLEGGGDRVRLSHDLERDAIVSGVIDPWKHTNAKRQACRKPRVRRKQRTD